MVGPTRAGRDAMQMAKSGYWITAPTLYPPIVDVPRRI